MAVTHNGIIDKLHFDGKKLSTCELVELAHNYNFTQSVSRQISFANTKSELILEIADFFKQQSVNGNIESFCMSSAKICPKGALIIADFVQHTQLTKLTFENYYVYSNLCVPIFAAIAQSSLQTLILKQVMLRNEEAEAFIDCMCQSSLIKLCLIKCDIPDTKSLSVMKSISQSAIQSLHLTNGYWDEMNAFPTDTESISNLIERSHLTQLSITNFDYDTTNIVAIAESIKRNHAFRKIAFHGTDACSEQIDVVCDLIENSTITNIKLHKCRMYDAHIVRLCASIKKSSITSLNLRSNHIGADGKNAICTLLEDHNLQKLSLRNSELSDATIKEMLPSVRKSSLIKFDVRNYPMVHQSIMDEIEEILKVQKHILSRFKKTKSSRCSVTTC